MTKDSHVKLANLHGGRGEMGWIQPACSCGWEGKKHYAHNDYQYTNANEEFMNHRNKPEVAKEVQGKTSLPYSEPRFFIGDDPELETMFTGVILKEFP